MEEGESHSRADAAAAYYVYTRTVRLGVPLSTKDAADVLSKISKDALIYGRDITFVSV